MMCGESDLALKSPKLAAMDACCVLYVIPRPHNEHFGARCNVDLLGGWSTRGNGNISYFK